MQCWKESIEKEEDFSVTPTLSFELNKVSRIIFVILKSFLFVISYHKNRKLGVINENNAGILDLPVFWLSFRLLFSD